MADYNDPIGRFSERVELEFHRADKDANAAGYDGDPRVFAVALAEHLQACGFREWMAEEANGGERARRVLGEEPK